DGGVATETGTLLGTPAYMAPEQAAGAATAASDQFSFCVTAWHALYGVRPFAGTTLDALLAAIAAGERVAPADERARDVPPAVHDALVRGLAADPAARWPSMAELVAAIGGGHEQI